MLAFSERTIFIMLLAPVSTVKSSLEDFLEIQDMLSKLRLSRCMLTLIIRECVCVCTFNDVKLGIVYTAYKND